jgi:D-sedoheptulose 7-phosphate isomerase
MVETIKKNLLTSIDLRNQILNDELILKSMSLISEKIIECYKNGNKVYFCGNGGSFADAQHLSAELNGRFYFDRDPLEVVLLASNVSYLTAVANDYSYDDIFSRELRSSVKEGDILISFSTSGKSKNIINGINSVKNKNIIIISFLGNDGGEIKDISDISIVVPSNDTARIQECHTFMGHTIIEIVENKMFKN